jgi:hypothetical protein
MTCRILIINIKEKESCTVTTQDVEELAVRECLEDVRS